MIVCMSDVEQSTVHGEWKNEWYMSDYMCSVLI